VAKIGFVNRSGIENCEMTSNSTPMMNVGGVLSHLLQLYGNNWTGQIKWSGSATLRHNVCRQKCCGEPTDFHGFEDHPAPNDVTITSLPSAAGRLAIRMGQEAMHSAFEVLTPSKHSVRSWMPFEQIPFTQDKGEFCSHGVSPHRGFGRFFFPHSHSFAVRHFENTKLHSQACKSVDDNWSGSHHLESQLNVTARVLEIDAQFVHLPSIVIATFGDADTRTSETHFVKATVGIDLGQLHRVHHVYKLVVYDHTWVGEGSAALHKILNESPLYSIFAMSPFPLLEVVLILPGYVILCSSLELASKNLIAGSVKMVYAVIYSLFLGFGISKGSDFYYLLDPKARHITQMHSPAPVYTLSGSFVGMNGTIPGMNGMFTFSNATGTSPTGKGELHQRRIQCHQEPSWGWWRQPASPYWSILLVPMFSFFLSLWNLKPIWTKQMPVMVIISCIGWVCNYFAKKLIFDRSDSVSFFGAFMIGLLGNMYSRLFEGTAFTSMVTGVLFLVPSGITAAGGLAMTYHSNSGDSYSNGLIIGFRMVQVAIGITVGLFFSSFFVYSFGRGKSTATFTF
ncbi:hypothetical protein PSTT_16861, partial [Puccinia striiformis]